VTERNAMNDMTTTSYIYDYNLDEFHFEGEATVEQYDPHYKPIVTINSVYMDGKELPKPLQSDWLIDKLEDHVLTIWTMEQRTK
jgi:hypothetical protein